MAKKEIEEVNEVKEEKKIDYKERVVIKLPRKKGETSLFVSVNDYTANIQRGVEVRVPLYVALHLQECMEQEEKTDRMLEGLPGYEN